MSVREGYVMSLIIVGGIMVLPMALIEYGLNKTVIVSLIISYVTSLITYVVLLPYSGRLMR